MFTACLLNTWLVPRWLQQHELAVREGRAQGFQEDAVPCVRLLSDEHFVKRIAKVNLLEFALVSAGTNSSTNR